MTDCQGMRLRRLAALCASDGKVICDSFKVGYGTMANDGALSKTSTWRLL
jgi:hypothetical protein